MGPVSVLATRVRALSAHLVRVAAAGLGTGLEPSSRMHGTGSRVIRLVPLGRDGNANQKEDGSTPTKNVRTPEAYICYLNRLKNRRKRESQRFGRRQTFLPIRAHIMVWPDINKMTADSDTERSTLEEEDVSAVTPQTVDDLISPPLPPRPWWGLSYDGAAAWLAGPHISLCYGEGTCC
ncbi:hypothetical protein NDU88_003102 [Pleurodeles waltl]|uniref:Nuclear transcription factor Y subunit n=1 Tax=Pleurodeles waltl TaxID=8319 RepID=A0AAV7TMH3_PLEWA|nr:hypothetical protein NDU88_003102 [Pleurodeles waltl]